MDWVKKKNYIHIRVLLMLTVTTIVDGHSTSSAQLIPSLSPTVFSSQRKQFNILSKFITFETGSLLTFFAITVPSVSQEDIALGTARGLTNTSMICYSEYVCEELLML